MASPPPATWSVTACLRYRGGLEIHAAAENILPGWGSGGERLSFLLRLRRCLRLAVTSQCGRSLASTEPSKTRAIAPAERNKPRAKFLRFLRSRLARVPRILSVWRRKKPPPPPRAAAAANPGPRTQAITSLLKSRALSMRPATTTVLCFVAALAVAAASVAALRLMAGLMIANASCTSWRCVLAKKFVKFLGPPLYEFLGLPNLSLKWLFSK